MTDLIDIALGFVWFGIVMVALGCLVYGVTAWLWSARKGRSE